MQDKYQGPQAPRDLSGVKPTFERPRVINTTIGNKNVTFFHFSGLLATVLQFLEWNILFLDSICFRERHLDNNSHIYYFKIHFCILSKKWIRKKETLEWEVRTPTSCPTIWLLFVVLFYAFIILFGINKCNLLMYTV